MKSLLLGVAITLLSVGLVGCGDAGKAAVSGKPSNADATRSVSPGGYLRGDHDGDGNVSNDEDDDATRNFGDAAGAADTLEITALVKRYFAVAAAEEGAAACSLVDVHITKGVGLQKAVPPAYVPAPGSSVLRGKNCPQLVSLIFKLDHEEIAADALSLHVTSVRVAGLQGLALLGFKTTGESKLPLLRERGAWRIDALLYSELP